MNNEFLLLIKKHTDTLIEQTKTKPQETLEFKMNKQMQTFSFNPPINLVEEGKWLLAVSSFECTKSVFNITKENNSFSIIVPGHWEDEFSEKINNEVNRLLELRSLESHVDEVRKRGNTIKIGDKEYNLSHFDNHKYEIIKELKEAKYKDIRDLVHRMRLSYDEIMDILDLKYIPTKRTGYSLDPGIYEVDDLNNTLKSILPDNVKVTVSIDDIRLKSNLKINQTLIFTEKSFFYTILGYTQSRSYPLEDINGHYQLIAGSYKSNKPINITRIDKVHLKCDCIQGSIVNGIRKPILYSFALSSPPGHKINKEPRVKLFKKVNKSVLSHITFYFEDDAHKPVAFNNETISFTCQLFKIQVSYLYMYNYFCTYKKVYVQLFLYLYEFK